MPKKEFKYREYGFCQPQNRDADRIVHEAGYAAYGLYAYMLSMRHGGKDRGCFPSEQYLSDAANQGTTKQVKALLGKLKNINAIWWDEHDKTGQGKSRSYKFPSIAEDLDDIRKTEQKRVERAAAEKRRPKCPAPVDEEPRHYDDGEPDWNNYDF